MRKIFIFTYLFFLLIPITPLYAQEETSFEGVVVSSSEIPCSEVINDTYTCFEYVVEIKDTKESVTTMPIFSETGSPKFKENDSVYITFFSDEYGNEQWSITGYERNTPILILILIFSLVAIVIGKRQGLGSLISLLFTILMLYVWAIPKILSGSNVMVIGIMTVVVTLIVIMYLSHGFNKKSSIAIVSTIIGIFIVGVLAKVFMNLINVDGSGSEEAFLLLSQTDGSINLGEVFFISILISAMGILDDVVMSQVSSIQEIYLADRTLNTMQLYSKAMNIGRDHLSSMVNTLFIAYAGSSLALVMLLTYSEGGVGNVLKTDVIAEEIVRTLTASIGILLIVPIASIIAARVIPLTISSKSTI